MLEDWLQFAVWGGIAGLMLAVWIIERPGRRPQERRGFEVTMKGERREVPEGQRVSDTSAREGG